MKNSNSSSRLGLTVSRKVGNAVQRNRIKRIIREIFRKNGYLQTISVDFSVIAKKGAADLTTRQIIFELDGVMGQLGL